MKPDQQQVPPVQNDPNQPVAYDASGRPLYAHPPVVTEQPTHVVHMTRAIDPVDPVISPEVVAKHDESMRKYPVLNLSRGEYVISMVQRHPIGLVAPLGICAFLLFLVMVGLGLYPSFAESNDLPTVDQLLVPASLFMLLIAIGGYITAWVYLQNKFFLTNESVIQEIQTSLFAHHEQTVSLSNIEDASYRQTGLIQSLFNYGSIRLSTEGDETTYRFHYVANPKDQIAVLNNAVEAFKNGRPVDDN